MDDSEQRGTGAAGVPRLLRSRAGLPSISFVGTNAESGYGRDFLSAESRDFQLGGLWTTKTEWQHGLPGPRHTLRPRCRSGRLGKVCALFRKGVVHVQHFVFPGDTSAGLQRLGRAGLADAAGEYEEHAMKEQKRRRNQ